MGFDCFVSNSVNFTFGFLTHNVLVSPAVPVPTPMFSWEIFAPVFWPPGYAMNQNQLTQNVRHMGFSIAQSGHDSGMLVPDITPPIPVHWYYAISWPFASRKVTFAASTVKMEGKPTGCSQTLLVPCPMMACGDPVSAPTAFFNSNFMNTVKVGMSWGDWGLGWLKAGLTMAIDAVCEVAGGTRGGKKAGDALGDFLSNYGRRAYSREAMEKVAETATESIARQVLEESLGKMVPMKPQAFAKRGLNAAAGLLTSSLEGNPTGKVKVVDGPFAGLEVSSSGQDGLGLQTDTMGHQTQISQGKGVQKARFGESL